MLATAHKIPQSLYKAGFDVAIKRFLECEEMESESSESETEAPSTRQKSKSKDKGKGKKVAKSVSEGDSDSDSDGAFGNDRRHGRGFTVKQEKTDDNDSECFVPTLALSSNARL